MAIEFRNQMSEQTLLKPGWQLVECPALTPNSGTNLHATGEASESLEIQNSMRFRTTQASFHIVVSCNKLVPMPASASNFKSMPASPAAGFKLHSRGLRTTTAAPPSTTSAPK